MSGETETNVSGWTTDTLKYYVDAAYSARDKANDERFVGQERATIDAFAASEKAIKDAFAAEEKVIRAFHDLIDDRDLRYQQRFEAQQQAVSDAFKAHEKLTEQYYRNMDHRLSERDAHFADRFHAAEKAVDAALASAERAVSKAEVATEKRFEGVNEFRAQLSDQARDFMPRKEYEVQHAPLVERIAAVEQALERGGATRAGSEHATTVSRDAQRLQLTIMGFAVTIILAIITIVTFVSR